MFSGYQSKSSFLGTKIYNYEDKSVLCGFTGYPHLNLLLSAVQNLDHRNIIFLGIAGEIGGQDRSPGIFQVGKIRPSGFFRCWPASGPMDLPVGHSVSLSLCPPAVAAVSVDCIRRETPRWLADQLSTGARCVEMELFPLCYLLTRPPRAVLVTSDAVTAGGIKAYRWDEVKTKFRMAYHWLNSIPDSD